MDKKLIPGTTILCAQATVLGVFALGGALCAYDWIRKQWDKVR